MKDCIKYFVFLQFGSSRHAGECVQRLGDHHHLSPKQQTAGGGGSLYQADGQHGGLHDLHLCRCIHVQPAGHCCGQVMMEGSISTNISFFPAIIS